MHNDESVVPVIADLVIAVGNNVMSYASEKVQRAVIKFSNVDPEVKNKKYRYMLCRHEIYRTQLYDNLKHYPCPRKEGVN